MSLDDGIRKDDGMSVEGMIGVDWDMVRRRIAQVGEVLSGAGEIDEAVLKSVWERRAAQLAQKLEEKDHDEPLDLVLARLSGEVYGLPVHSVIDIRAMERITCVPRTPPWVAGISHWRGRILTVVDAQCYLGLRDAPREPRDSYLVVVESPSMQIGLLVDEVLSIGRLQVYEKQLPDRDAEPPRRYIIGMAQSDDPQHPRVAILDPARMLTDHRLIVREEML